MKRMFSFFLALALLAVLSGCGKQEPTPSKPDEPTPPPEEGITGLLYTSDAADEL